MTAALLVATLPFSVARASAGHTEGWGWQCGGSGMQSWYTLIFALHLEQEGGHRGRLGGLGGGLLLLLLLWRAHGDRIPPSACVSRL